MENPGAVTFTEEFLFRSRVTDDLRRRRAVVIAHEMAHMWFGDLVTMRWWDDLWLNESFAELLGFLTTDRATRFEHTWVDFAATRKAWGYRADQLPTTHPVTGTATDTRSAMLDFDGISYAKGASVLRQLMATIGEDAFFAGVRLYLDRHAFANTGFADLLAALSEASGRSLQEWARLWLQVPGVSTVRVSHDATQLVQESAPLRPHRLGLGVYDLREGAFVRRTRLDLELVDQLVLDTGGPAALLLPNDDDLTFAKVRLDPGSLAVVLADLRRLGDPLARAVCWASLWDSCRDGELSAAQLVDAVLANVVGESDPAVVSVLLSQARRAATSFCVDGGALRRRLAAYCWDVSVRSEPGSDLQLAHARAFAACTDEVERLTALLAGETVPAGLVVDTDLRWDLVEAAAALGGIDEATLAAERSADGTEAGERRASTALAARPDAATKQRSWDAATTGGLSKAAAEALALGFWRPGQDDLLRPYVRRYVQEIPALFLRLGPQASQALALRLFPSTLVEQATLDATGELLAGTLSPELRRVVLEERDDLARALRVRAAQ